MAEDSRLDYGQIFWRSLQIRIMEPAKFLMDAVKGNMGDRLPR